MRFKGIAAAAAACATLALPATADAAAGSLGSSQYGGAVWVMGNYSWNGTSAWGQYVTAAGGAAGSRTYYTTSQGYGNYVKITHARTAGLYGFCASAYGWFNGVRQSNANC